MARRKPAPPRKRRTREHVIADLAVNHVERQVLLCGHVVDRVVHDYGIDLLLFTFDANGELEVGEVPFQVKATERIRRLTSSDTIAFRVARSDLQSWLFEPMPVILALYDATAGVAYWVYVQAYFEALPGFNLFRAGQTVTIRIHARQVLDPDAVRRIAQFRDDIHTQLSGGLHHHD